MRNKGYSKRGGFTPSVFFWVIVLVVVAVTVALTTSLFFSRDFDIREKEANIFLERVFNCLVYRANLREGVVSKDFDLFDFCNLDKGFLKKSYVRLEIFDESGSRVLFREYGLKELYNPCRLYLREDIEISKKYPLCLNESVDVFYPPKHNNKSLIKLMIGIKNDS